MMDTMEAIDRRISRRSYLPTPLPEKTVRILQGAIAEANTASGLQISLVQNGGAAFSGFRRSYGMFSGVRDYFALAGPCNDLCLMEKVGYYGELLVLEATRLELGTCWVGGTYDKKSCPVRLRPGDELVCVISVGAVPKEPGWKEKLIYRMVHRSTKSVEQMYTAEGTPPDWFLAGVCAAQKAPSALNRQPVMFSWKNGIAAAEVPDYATHQAIDLGIAKAHFELAAGCGRWKPGNGGAFCRK